MTVTATLKHVMLPDEPVTVLGPTKDGWLVRDEQGKQIEVAEVDLSNVTLHLLVNNLNDFIADWEYQQELKARQENLAESGLDLKGAALLFTPSE